MFKFLNKGFLCLLWFFSIHTACWRSWFSAIKRAFSVVSFSIILVNFWASEPIASFIIDFISCQTFLQSVFNNVEEAEWLNTSLLFDLTCFITWDESKGRNPVFFHSLLILIEIKAAWYAGQNKMKKSLFEVQERP